MQRDDTIRDLTDIQRLWPELTAEPGTRKPRPARREPTPEQVEARAAAWAEERREVELGIHGRGASPAPCSLDAILASTAIQTEMLALADRVAARVQAPEPLPRREVIERVSLSKTKRSVRIDREQPAHRDPGRWRYAESWAHGVSWACTWLIGAVRDGVPALVLDDIGSTVRSTLRRLLATLDGEQERRAGVCPCGTPLTVAPGDPLITCTGCREAIGLQDWLQHATDLRSAAPRVDTRPSLIDERERELRARSSAA